MQKAACKAGPNRKTARAGLRLCTPLCRVAGRAVRPRVRLLLLLAERSHPSKTFRRNYDGVGWQNRPILRWTLGRTSLFFGPYSDLTPQAAAGRRGTALCGRSVIYHAADRINSRLKIASGSFFSLVLPSRPSQVGQAAILGILARQRSLTRMRMWRNWQTRMIQVHVPEMVLRFKSSHPHQNRGPRYRLHRR
jgi:hypothetical protein